MLRDVPRSSFVHLEVLLRNRHGLYVDARLKAAGEDELTAMKPDDVVTVPRANRSKQHRHAFAHHQRRGPPVWVQPQRSVGFEFELSQNKAGAPAPSKTRENDHLNTPERARSRAVAVCFEPCSRSARDFSREATKRVTAPLPVFGSSPGVGTSNPAAEFGMQH